ncbi:double-strand break repair protein AddB [Ancylobacter oerskovii]|uniref:Double-strand break repair protein AddB n=1 Tax=Ancylobacter oerskovii TaxID=459519 RepID=A0ABW4YTT6_9HYPH|nr:double-strand break repair protein AddB [Ancylobacter oerskovii]MBS7543393.1 double-strand break repair protein AddB [Ancylobacter oerskovii]
MPASQTSFDFGKAAGEAGPEPVRTARRPARVFTIPASAPFLPVLAEALLDGTLVPGFAPRGDPLALASATVYLPTRRAGRLFAEELRRRMGGTTLLPKIVPVGDVDEDALIFAEESAGPPKAVASTTRRLALASLVGKWRAALGEEDGRSAVAAGPGAGLALADALAGLIDEMAAQQVPWSRLDDLVPGEHDRYWDMALDFLKIAREVWPALRGEEVDAALRRDRLIDAEAARLAALGEAAPPVVAAGSTGSMPATARLLDAVSRLPRGALVLPGLDRHMSEVDWNALTREPDPAPSHPQYGLARLLSGMHLRRAEVVPLAEPAAPHRELLLSEALLPAEATQGWARLAERLPEADRATALADVTLIEADDAREEALAIALVLRETLEAEARRAALITPDRDLARRVAAELLRFGIAIDDSAGEPLSESGAGRFARLIADAAAERLAPLPLAALLRHAAARFGLDRAALAQATDALELMVLRGPRPAPGAEGLAAAVAGFRPEDWHRDDPRRMVDIDRRERAADLARRLGEALAPLSGLGPGLHGFADLVDAHRAAVMAALAEEGGAREATPDEAALAAAFDELAAGAPLAPAMSLADYAAALPLLLASTPVRPPLDAGARLRIYGPLEARLVHVDRVVLASLVEDVWPAMPRPDPWLSRPMRAALGLDVPERRIGLAAHDFAQACGAPELVLTYPRKLGGAPTVPSRFLQRLAAVGGRASWEAARARGERWRRVAAVLDVEPAKERIKRPAPTPPAELRPTRLSVTEIETFLRDPYAIYARHVLGLRPLDPLDAAPGAGERGTAIHEALGEFAKAHPGVLPADAAARLAAFGRAAFAPLAAFPAEHALWWARFEKLIPLYLAWERGRRAGLDRVIAEAGGHLLIPGTRGPFRLNAYADRIEQRRGGGLALLDFKTGMVPTAKQTRANYSPQLPLEAAIATRGGFEGVPGEPAVELAYVKLGTAVLKEISAIDKDATALGLAEDALERVTVLIRAFENPAQPYIALRRTQFRGRSGPYDHLARVREWSIGEEEEAE